MTATNTMDAYAIYGDLRTRETAALATIFVAKHVPFNIVAESSSLSLALASRAGTDRGPYLRTPEGFVLADLHAILDWLERVHPLPRVVPTTPVRNCTSRVIESWVELWLPIWPRRSWSSLEGIGRHLDSSGFMLGVEATRSDWLLAAWLETEVLIHDHARQYLTRTAPRLVSLGRDLLAATQGETPASASDIRVNTVNTVSTANAANVDKADSADDVIPISILQILEEIGRDYHGYLVANHQACKDHADRVTLDLGLGNRAMRVRTDCEARRAEIGRVLAASSPEERREVRQILEPVGAWHALTLPPALLSADAADPRSL